MYLVTANTLMVGHSSTQEVSLLGEQDTRQDSNLTQVGGTVVCILVCSDTAPPSVTAE